VFIRILYISSAIFVRLYTNKHRTKIVQTSQKPWIRYRPILSSGWKLHWRFQA